MSGCNECNKWKQKHDHIFAEVRRQNERIAALESLLKRAYGYTTAADDLLPEEIKAYFAEKGDE